MLNKLIQKNQLNQLIIDKLAAPLWRPEVAEVIASRSDVPVFLPADGVTAQVHMQLLPACAAWRKEDLLCKDGPKKISKETEHAEGSRHLFKLSSARLQEAAMIPGLFPASGYRSKPGRL